MAFKGSLREASLADVCQLLALGMKTGCLSVTDRTRFGQIYFDRGRISYARIVNRRDRLGDMLVRDGRLTHEQLREVLDAQEHTPDRRLGELLIEHGLVGSEDIEHYVRSQVEGAIFHLFTWSRGSFFFQAGQRPETAEMLFSINAESLLLEAARRTDEWTLIEKKIPSLDILFAIEHERLEASGANLTREQEQVVPLLDGTHSLQDVVDATGLMEFDVGHAVFGLVQAGLAREVGRNAAGKAEGGESEAVERRNLAHAFYRASMLEDAEREFRRVLELSRDDATALLHLGLIALRNQRPLAAVRELKTLLQVHGARYAAFINLAVALEQLGREDDALLVLEEAERMRPGESHAPLARGMIALRRSSVTEAAAHFAEVRARTPADDTLPAQYFYFAGLAAALAGEPDVARSLANEGIVAHPDSPPLLLLSGLLSERQGDMDAAEFRYEQAIELDPMLVQVHRNLGDVAYRRGALDEALSQYQRAAELAPDLGDELFARLGNLHYRARDREAAVRSWKRALELNPGNEAVRNNLEIVAHAGA